MKKYFAALFILLFFFQAFSFDWGILLYNDTSLSGHKPSQFAIKQTDCADVRFSSVLNKRRSLSISFNGFYEFVLDKTATATEGLKNVVDIADFSISFETASGRGSAFLFSAGRIPMSDLTGLVFSQSIDGMYMRLSNLRADFSVFGGYTGFLNAKSNTMLVPADTKYEAMNNAIYTLSPKYFPCGFSISFPTGMEGQYLDIQGLGFIDVNGDSYNRLYALVGFRGYWGGKCSYDFKTVFGTENMRNVMNMTVATVTIFPSKTFEIALSGNYASGKNAVFSPFHGFTSKTDISIYGKDLEYSGLLKAEVALSKAFNTFFYGECFVGAVLDCAERFSYFGAFANINVTLNVLDDLQFNLSVEQFVGMDFGNNNTNLSLKAVLEL